MMFGFLKYAAIAAVMASSASAATIFDEAVNGEAGGPMAPTALGTLASGETSTVFGSDFEGISFAPDFSFVFGPGVDAYSFSVLADTTIDAGISEGGDAIDGGLFLDLTGPVSANTAVSPGFTINLLGVTLTPGDYLLQVGSEGLYDYRIDFNVTEVSAVPLPASALLLLSGLAGFGLISRRRS